MIRSLVSNSIGNKGVRYAYNDENKEEGEISIRYGNFDLRGKEIPKEYIDSIIDNFLNEIKGIKSKKSKRGEYYKLSLFNFNTRVNMKSKTITIICDNLDEKIEGI